MRTTYEEIFELLGIKNVTSKTQKKNGTHCFEIPFKNYGGTNIKLATYKSGSIRNVNSCYSCYQINPTRLEQYSGKYVFKHKVRIPITSHEGRLEFLLKFIIRNYYKKQHTLIKWETHTIKQLSNVSVTVDGHKYNIQ
tara:strand:- start:341 stop:754 length:414 start_codon:yes stop_codon:yes gene_type:complete